MNKIIEGKRYNTETATLLASWHVGFSPRDNNFYSESLYITTSGNYFLHGKGNAGAKYSSKISENTYTGGEGIIPISRKEAQELVEKYLTADEYEAIFDVDEEINNETGDEKITLTLPSDLIKTLKERKETTGANISFQIAKLLREAGY